MTPPPIEHDAWSAWVLEQRHGSNAAYGARLQRQLNEIRDRVLDGAALAPGMTLADIGCGDGLIGFGAIDRVGRDLTVIFSDISEPLLKHTVDIAVERQLMEQCRFVRSSAESLAIIPAASVDAVTSRAVLAYLPQKVVALGEFWRILKPGGVLSIADPIFQDSALLLAAVGNGLRAGTLGSATAKLEMLHRWRSRQMPATIEKINAHPLTRFTERDLVRYAQRAGFVDIHLRLHIDVIPATPIPWDALLASAPFPGAPTLADVLASDFNPAERNAFEEAFRASFEAGEPIEQNTLAYLVARKPPA